METKQGFISMTPCASVVEVTPKIASAMLETSPGNRSMRDWYVKQLAAAMRRGEWRVTSQGIGFDVNGRLRDAHHRLSACILSGVSFKSVVVLGLRPDAYEVIDTGINRTYADRLNIKTALADVLRLGCAISLNENKPTADQMHPIIDAGLGAAAEALIEFCGTKRRYYSSAPMKLAACATIMSGADADYVMQQYKALCSMDFESMTSASQSLIRQVNEGKARAANTRDAIARGLRVFNPGRATISKIQISDGDIEQAISFVRKTILASVSS